MTTSRRHRSDSIAGQMAAFREAAAAGGIDWPDTVPRLPDATDQAAADVIFAEILRARPASEWRKWPYDLAQAARLASTTAEIDKIRLQLNKEGMVCLGGKSGTTTVVNPLVSVQSSLVAIANQLSRSLHLTLSVKGVEASQNRTAAAAGAAAVLGEGTDDDDAALLSGFDA